VDTKIASKVFAERIKNSSGKYYIQSNLDYPDSLGLDEIVQIVKGPDNRKYEY